MTLPRAVSQTLLRFGVAADTLSWIEDLHRVLGAPALEALPAVAEARGLAPGELRPEHLEGIRPRLGERYLRTHHAAWRTGQPTPGFWRDRSTEGGATGLVRPLGDVADSANPFSARVGEATRRALGEGQSPPRGILLLARNSHYEGNPGSFSFDLVPADLNAALRLNAAVGRQYTLPGSIGAASGRAVGDPAAALLWEVQPNVYKPGAGRNREAGPAFRRHRTWPMVTAIAAMAWLLEHGHRLFVLRGRALRGAHEVDPARPISAGIERLHDRTLESAAAALGRRLGEVDDSAAPHLARLGKVLLDREIAREGLAAVVREVLPVRALS